MNMMFPMQKPACISSAALRMSFRCIFYSFIYLKH